ncbi:MAG: redoxin domain-containing protein [Thermoplasmatales archaeon]|nr:redoxin domain-containing protein [Thermoplasmatales archaeon]
MRRDVLAELIGLRERLRVRDGLADRPDSVCDDAALEAMAALLPRSASDLMRLRGLGEAFVGKYGGDFLAVTSRVALEGAGVGEMPAGVSAPLRSMGKRFTDVGRGNRMINARGLTRGKAVDMADYWDDVPGFLDSDGWRALCDKGHPRYGQANALAREVNRDVMESGSYDLYVGYPFARGVPWGDFPVNAPLALFPVRLKRHRGTISLERDPEKDVLLNTALLLAGSLRTGEDAEDGVLADPSQEGLFGRLAEIYGSHGIRIGPPKSDVPTRYPEEDPVGDLEMVPCAVLGKFPVYADSVQRDFSRILDGGVSNAALNGLVGPRVSAETPPKEISEAALAYINGINSSQESAVHASGAMDAIVVQGPPGTGKSQAITAMIVSAVCRGETVLLVSEKKTALDVVRSRLGPVADGALLVGSLDDRRGFHSQILKLLTSEPSEPPAGTIGDVSASIESEFSKLKEIADVMYSPGEFGIEPYKLYYHVKKVDLNDPDEHARYVALRDNISRSLTEVGFDKLASMHGKFSDPSVLRNLSEYHRAVEDMIWLPLVDGDSVDAMKGDLEHLARAKEEANRGGIVDMRFAKGKLERMATEILGRHLGTFSENILRRALDDTESVILALDDFDRFSELMDFYNSLDRHEKTYGENLIALNTKMPWTLGMSNDELFAFIVKGHLTAFEEGNAGLTESIGDFGGIRERLDGLISEKMGICSETAEHVLRSGLENLRRSKSAPEMLRIAGSARKWSPAKFVSRFSFELLSSVRVWMMTPEAVSTMLPLEPGLFNNVIFDEASQMYVERAVPSIFRGRRVVVAGDGMQLKPSSVGTVRYGEGSGDSLLDVAGGKYPSFMLNFHYRSLYEELISFSNHAFYGGNLYVSPNAAPPDGPCIRHTLVPDGVWKNRSNVPEAEAVMRILRETIGGEDSVGVITFNAGQMDLLNDMIESEIDSGSAFGRALAREASRSVDGGDAGLFVKNVETVQGEERDVIVFSVGYARKPSGTLEQRFGWLNNEGGENRLNVAITRARKRMHVVTSFLPDELDVETPRNPGPSYLKKYLVYAMAVSSGDRGAQKGVLASFGSTGATAAPPAEGSFETQIRDALIERGYDATTDVGIGGYLVDVAVRHGGRYVMGIECDSRLYSGASTARERDYHRQKFLESRGWCVRRVWSHNWWNDPDTEIDAIVADVERAIAATAAPCAADEKYIMCPDVHMAMSKLSVGDKAPGFTLQSTDGTFDLGKALAEGPVLLNFYVGDFGLNCMNYMGKFIESFHLFEETGVRYVGINSDSLESHVSFKERLHIPFELLFDDGKKVAKEYGAIVGPGHMVSGFTNREIFVVGTDGLIKYVWRASVPKELPEVGEIVDGVRKGLGL